MSEEPYSQDIEPGATILNVLHIVEYMSPDGELWKIDLSHGGDLEEMPTGKYFELAEWARMIAMAPTLSEMIATEYFDDDEDSGDDDIADVTV